MDYENLLKKYPTYSQSKTQRSSSANQNSQKQESAQQIQPQALLKKLEEILQQRQQQFNQEKLKKKKVSQCKGDYSQRISETKNVKKLLENEKWKADLQNFVSEKKERKSAYPNLKSLQPSSQNLFDIFCQDNNTVKENSDLIKLRKIITYIKYTVAEIPLLQLEVKRVTVLQKKEGLIQFWKDRI